MVSFTEPLHTERLVLRLLAESDLTDIHAYQRLPEVTRFMLWNVRTLDESREHLTRRLTMTRLENDGDVLVVAVELPGTGGSPARLIGEITVFLRSTASRQAEIGWAFHPDFQGQGYATEAAGRMLDYAFTELNAHRVHATLDPRNSSSSALAERLGLVLEAHFREDTFFKGAWGDTAVYAILRSAWAQPGADQAGVTAMASAGLLARPGAGLPTIRVAAVVLLRERRVLMVTARGRDVLYLPGGKIDAGETAAEAVARESREEIAVELEQQSIRELFTVTVQAHGEPDGRLVAMTLFAATTADEPVASAEVDSVHWVTSADAGRCPPAGVETLERLVALGLID
ncbi:GNAT family N-acetyltransferase [Subtercola vilae]|uniref:GNAT family N-acetyltransferase n=1 Tax=Subtercola vilae TaxID=2056433 RepID=A0A4T2BVW7_9MICO|nr:GNAT family N-acetyltransferase [Subtercola vilae]TIH33748.1 GNAT family N-acetyltransferase [Subtercola vilae]